MVKPVPKLFWATEPLRTAELFPTADAAAVVAVGALFCAEVRLAEIAATVVGFGVGNAVYQASQDEYPRLASTALSSSAP